VYHTHEVENLLFSSHKFFEKCLCNSQTEGTVVENDTKE